MRKTVQQGRPARRARKLLLPAAALIAALALPAAAGAQQWTTSTNGPTNISNSNAGNVGVGTSAPAYELHVEGASSPTTNHLQGYFKNTGATYQFGGVGVDAQLQSHLRFFLNGSPKWQWRVGTSTGGEDLRAYSWALGRDVLSLTSGGNVGIGTAAPDNHLHIYNALGMGMLKVTGRDGGLVNVVDPSAPAGQQDYQWRSEDGVFRMALAPDSGAGSLLQQNILVANSSGNVGIGTAAPGMNGMANTLTVQGSTTRGMLEISTSQPDANGLISGQLGFFSAANAGGRQIAAIYAITNGTTAGNRGGNLVFFTKADNGVGAQVMVLDKDGDLGVGVANPTHRLEVGGDISATGNVTGATVNALYQDVAEWVPSSQRLSAGTVVVLDAERTNHVLASTKAYDTAVAGVVSAAPGVILGAGGEGKLKVATTGRVKVKVDATRAPIKVGDLLVTSDMEGVAMKSVPVDLGGTPIHRPGTIIGKALEPLEKGTGEILVLLSLQ